MDNRIVQFESKFVTFNEKNVAIDKGVNILDAFIEQLKKTKRTLTKDVQNDLQFLALDSLQFQITYLENEVCDLKKSHAFILNRTYGDYYKIYKYLLQSYTERFPIEKPLQDNVRIEQFPVYLDLDMYMPYPSDKLAMLHTNLCKLFKSIQLIINRKNLELDGFREKRSNGLNIHNFVTMCAFGTNFVKQELDMYMEHVEYIIEQHTKYISYVNKRLNTLIVNTHNDIDIKHLREQDALEVVVTDAIPDPMLDAEVEIELDDASIQMKIAELTNEST